MKKLILFLSIIISNSYATNTANEKSVIEQLFNTIIGSTIWNLDVPGIDGESTVGDEFGKVLSHGDYNGDGWQDLAIGIPGFNFVLFGTTNDVGTVLIIYGTPNGLSSIDHQYLFQSNNGAEGIEENDRFGESLASGDFNCDGFIDLAVGTPNEDIFIDGELRTDVGKVNVFNGSATGFAVGGQGSTRIFQGIGSGVDLDLIETGDRFGWRMASGNFNGDSFNGFECIDLAISAPFEDIGDQNGAGSVDVLYGGELGINGASNRDVLSQDTANVEGQAENGDNFGRSLAAGQFRSALVTGGTPYSDLVVGVSGEGIFGESHVGVVQVFNGAAVGLQENADDFIWSQTGSIEGSVDAGDYFGRSLAVGDFNGDLLDDLAIGVPLEDFTGLINAGAVNIIYASETGTGLTTIGNKIFHQNIDGMSGFAEDFDEFGLKLTSGDLNNDSYADLVIGVPFENGFLGAFHILFGGADGISTIDDLYEINIFGDPGDEMAFSMVVANFGNGTELAVSSPNDTVTGNIDAGSVEVFTFSDIIFENSFEN